jgi:hypothetical protein
MPIQSVGRTPKKGEGRTKDVVLNHWEEHIESQTPIASIIWFCQAKPNQRPCDNVEEARTTLGGWAATRKGRTALRSSIRLWSYPLRETRNRIAVTSWKQWIHFRRSDFWPPTSIITSRFLGGPAIVKCISWMPIVRARAKIISCGEGQPNRVLISGN